ncbi:MAG: hypothetical protein H6702_23560 [Myxococcales bacterium]|nr:hypothetical protein [Myxococcales bacterium]
MRALHLNLALLPLLAACSVALELDPPPQQVGREFGAADEGAPDARMFDFKPPDFGVRDAFRIDVGVADDGPEDAATPADAAGPCAHCTNPQGTVRCVGGACVPVCDPGAADLDGDPDNGCETRVLAGDWCGPDLVLPDAVTVVVEDLTLCPFDGRAESGALRIQAGRIEVRGTVDGRGKGHPGGGGGGGGSGGQLNGRGGQAGAGGALPNAEPGADGAGPVAGGSCGGDGGRGGRGGGPAGGEPGDGGAGGRRDGRCAQDGGPGDPGAQGGAAVYLSAPQADDDLTVHRGSGGGGGGGGGGCQPQSWGVCGCPGTEGASGPGGGGGAAGSPGGALVVLRAEVELRVSGEIQVDGLAGVGADGGAAARARRSPAVTGAPARLAATAARGRGARPRRPRRCAGGGVQHQ